MNPNVRLLMIVVVLICFLLGIFENSCRKQGKSLASDCV